MSSSESVEEDPPAGRRLRRQRVSRYRLLDNLNLGHCHSLGLVLSQPGKDTTAGGGRHGLLGHRGLLGEDRLHLADGNPDVAQLYLLGLYAGADPREHAPPSGLLVAHHRHRHGLSHTAAPAQIQHLGEVAGRGSPTPLAVRNLLLNASLAYVQEVLTAEVLQEDPVLFLVILLVFVAHLVRFNDR
jgi:hypothetical protein